MHPFLLKLTPLVLLISFTVASVGQEVTTCGKLGDALCPADSECVNGENHCCAMSPSVLTNS